MAASQRSERLFRSAFCGFSASILLQDVDETQHVCFSNALKGDGFDAAVLPLPLVVLKHHRTHVTVFVHRGKAPGAPPVVRRFSRRRACDHDFRHVRSAVRVAVPAAAPA
eukprot:CAMPEP_0171603142 /NCGR_PEP_ID=MMETSP0990-20121206/5850_1 /TAXON_ID=483369 /ORGANISM="non described non described, Strain CCMP2098" /LENGTH=109 /DNA_ID=CAMNT_0012165449 /DNA_START=222 /DNA_END=547 /DNA_ORIENTATION=+